MYHHSVFLIELSISVSHVQGKALILPQLSGSCAVCSHTRRCISCRGERLQSRARLDISGNVRTADGSCTGQCHLVARNRKTLWSRVRGEYLSAIARSSDTNDWPFFAFKLMAVAASPNGDLLATSCKATSAEHAVIRIYDTSTWKQLGSPLSGHNLTIARIRFSNSGQYVLSCSRDRTWRLFKRSEEGEFVRSDVLTVQSSAFCSQVSRRLPRIDLIRG